eukprot:GHUV01013909.1.p1 GENE.GHUV01013909.1~~GHUV01013909.1.p1  ORF type:complete len:274 (+),score=126.30 GHUV01013909.1:476-1297(+)
MSGAEGLALPGCGQDDVDQDLLLARVLQEQERAFHALMSSSYRTGGSSLPNSSYYGPDSTADDSEADIDDEELARRLQSEEHQQLYQLQQQQGDGFLDFEFADEQEELDYDQLGYEDLNAIGDVAGKVSKGLQPEVINQLPVLQVQQIKQQQQCRGQGQVSQQQMAAKALQASALCAICQMDYDDSDHVKLLPCCHVYHQECVDQWLGLNKTCPICNKEVAPNGSTSSADCSSPSKRLAAAVAATAAVSPLKASPAAGAALVREAAVDTETCP